MGAGRAWSLSQVPSIHRDCMRWILINLLPDPPPWRLTSAAERHLGTLVGGTCCNIRNLDA